MLIWIFSGTLGLQPSWGGARDGLHCEPLSVYSTWERRDTHTPRCPFRFRRWFRGPYAIRRRLSARSAGALCFGCCLALATPCGGGLEADQHATADLHLSGAPALGLHLEVHRL